MIARGPWFKKALAADITTTAILTHFSDPYVKRSKNETFIVLKYSVYLLYSITLLMCYKVITSYLPLILAILFN